MEERARVSVAFSPMQIAAGLSVAALVTIGTWQTYERIADGGRIVHAKNDLSETEPHASTPFVDVNWQAPPPSDRTSTGGARTDDPDGISNIANNVLGALMGSYATLTENGAYTPEEGTKIAEDIGESLRASISYETYSANDIKTDDNTSYDRMLVYRSDLRIALEPLLKNPGYELSIFANYIESKDTRYLRKLKDAAENYRAAVLSAAHITVPKDAVSYHIEILNALSEFGATIERMTEHADDAFASAALLRTYNSSEVNLMTSFNALAGYYRNKKS